MATKKDGGPAFPTKRKEWDCCLNRSEWTMVEGLTKRQWYAGLAMQGIITSESYTAIKSPVLIAELAFVVADAMIAEGEK
jgi:hypothetical protein